MGFGTDLQGRESHDALLQIQDTEIRLLENMKLCLTKRIEGDKKYIQSLTSFVQTAQKIETTEYHEYCSLFKVLFFSTKCAARREKETSAFLTRSNKNWPTTKDES